MSDKKPTPLEEAQALVLADQKKRVANVQQALKEFLAYALDQRCSVMPVYGEGGPMPDGQFVIAPPKLEIRPLD